jgi:hypothetical protein
MNSSCPSLLDLLSPDSAVRAHLKRCQRCQALEHSVTPQEQPPATGPTSEHRDDHAPQRTSVWTVSAPHTDTFLFVALLEVDEVEAWVAPVADDIAALDTDLCLPEERLEFSVWVRCADTFKLLREQLQDEIGRLSEDETDLVVSCAQTLLDGSSFIGDERFGAPVFADHDPRLHAAEDWKLSTSRWREPWKVLAVADELGAVCAVRREHLGLSVAELAEDVDVNAEDWTRFEAAQLDVPASLPTLRLAAAVRKLSLPQGRKLLMLAAASVTLTHRPDAGATAPALARRRQGIRRKTSPPDPAELRKAADDYSAALGRALGL